MNYPTTIEKTEQAILQMKRSGLINPIGELILTQHLKYLMAYCSRKENLTKKYNEAKNSYWRRQYGEALTALHGLMTDYLKIMNDRASENEIYWSGIGGC